MSIYNDIGSEHSSTKLAEEANIHFTKKKKIIFWVYLITITIFFGGAIALSYNAYQPMATFYTSDTYYFANQVAYEWTLGYVKDVIVTASSTCPTGYESAANFVWPGVGFGCYCNITGGLTIVLEGYCTPALVQMNCKNLVDQTSKVGNFWKNQSNICFKRSTVSMANEEKYNGNNKICGSSNSLVIMPTSQPCPFVNLSMSSLSLENHTIIASDPSSLLSPIYLTYNSTSPYSFYSYPIGKFKVSEYQFCLMNEDNGIDPDHSDFILLKQLRACAAKGNYTTIDSMTEIQFYASNPALQALTTINGFPPPSNWIYSLGFANTPSWTYQCRHNYNNKFSMKQARSQFNYAFYSQLQALIILLMVAIIVLGVEIVVVGLRRVINTAIYPAGYKQIYLCGDFLIALSRYIIDFLCKFVILAVATYLSYTSFYNWNWWKSASNYNCHDGNPQIQKIIMVNYSILYNNFFRIMMALTFITFAMIVVDVIHFCYIYKNQLQYYLVESQKKMLVKQDEEQFKWMEVKDKDIDDHALDKNIQNDEFKITMAQNLFANDQIPNEKIKKKKKKKLFTSKKQQRQEEAKQAKQEGQPPLFNSYDIDQPPFLQIQSISNLKDTPDNQRKRKKK